MENEIHAAICNRIGQEHNPKHFGQRVVYDAQGKTLKKLDDENSVSIVHIPLLREQESNLSFLNNR